MPNFILSIEDEEPINGILNLQSDLLRTKHDFEVPLDILPTGRQNIVLGTAKHGLPETIKVFDDGFISLMAIWGVYWQSILKLFNPNMSASEFNASWNSLTAPDRAFTNKRSRDDLAIEMLICGGATVRSANSQIFDKVGQQWREVHCLDGSRNPPVVPSSIDQIDLTLHFFATNITPKKLSDGTNIVDGFPQFENCIVPFMGKGPTNLININRLESVNSITSPFNLPS